MRETIRALARAGRAVLVGHGSVYMTRDLPGGIHLRLIAPREIRIEHLADRFALSHDDAEKRMERIDRQRRKFFQHFWPGQPHRPEIFTAVFNTAQLSEQQLIRAIVAMLPNACG
jgi:cytidylate kinase